jgi:putative hydrolase of the HAD superfamily
VTTIIKPFDVIFFDAGSVLFTTHRKHEERIAAVLTARGYPPVIQQQAITAAKQAVHSNTTQKSWLHTWSDEQKYWVHFYTTLCSALPDTPPAFPDELFYLCHFVAHCTLFDDVHATLTELQSHYRLGVISNAYPSLDWVFDRLDIRHYFTHITLSAFVGYAKPDPQIYHSALAATQCRPDRAFFIDNKRRNVEAAQTLGMHAIPLVRASLPSEGSLTTLTALPAYLATCGEAVANYCERTGKGSCSQHQP